MIMNTKFHDLSSEEAKEIAIEKFKAYQEDGVIKSKFNDDRWILSDEKEEKVLDFEISEFNFYAIKPRYKRSELIYLLKIFLIVQMGSYQIVSLQNGLNTIKRIIEVTAYMTKPNDLLKKGVNQEEYSTLIRNTMNNPWQVRFFEYGDLPGMSEIAEILNDDNLELFYSTPIGNGKRELAEFKSYFLFGKYFDAYWKEATLKEKLHFYPAYIFFHLTMILPLRVTEFCVLPSNPIRKDHDGYHLSVRRSNLKGKNHGIGYRIDKDYDIYEYAVTDDIAKLLLAYEELTKDNVKVEGCFWTIVHQPTKNFFTNDEAKRVYKAQYINRLIDELYRIFEMKYGTTTITLEQYKERKRTTEFEQLLNHELVCIRAGDTRHIAAIGLVANGCNPMILREFMGHENIRSAEHYYSNVKEYLDSYIVMAYDRVPKEYRYLKYESEKRKYQFKSLGRTAEKIAGGFCFSELDSAECIKNKMQCEICKYFVAENMDTDEYRRHKDEQLQKQIDYVTSLFRMELRDGRLEEIGIAVKELQTMISERKQWILKTSKLYKEEE